MFFLRKKHLFYIKNENLYDKSPENYIFSRVVRFLVMNA